MALSAGAKLGPYEIASLLGKGGMGEVYLARDPRLGRDIAIKICAEQFSERFEREARAVAALNHPNICQLYDVGSNFLVMELIEGESPKGPLPVEEALRIARQIASALDAAHSKGIVHRDLKPANIKIKPDGTVKVLDFGLAKNVDAPAGDPENSPTMTFSPTRAGMIIGTAAYMSPEQARGKNVDKRTDIWAFGVVLYELLTGARPFGGQDLTEILASVVKDAPDLNKAPVKVRKLLAKCLEKDPEKRLRDIGDAWGLLEETADAKRPVVWPWVAAAVLGVAAVVGWMRAGTRDAPSLTFDIVPPVGVTLDGLGRNAAAPVISPDGSAVLYLGSNGHYVRCLDSLESKLVARTGSPTNPAFWSPDSTTVVYPSLGPGQWMKVRMPDGAPQAIAPLGSPSRSGSWSESGTILLSAELGTPLSGPAAGGEFKPVEVPEQLRGDIIRYPEFLPGSEEFLFFVEAKQALYLATLRDGKALNPIVLARNETPARYTPAGGGRLLFIRNDNLYSQRLNLSSRKLEGEAELVVQGMASGETSDFSVARNGTIAWRSGAAGASLLTEFDRQGNVIGTPGPAVRGSYLFVSPDGKKLVIVDDPMFLMNVGQTARIVLPKDVQWMGWSEAGAKLVGRREYVLVEMPASGFGEIRELRQLTRDGSGSISSYFGRFITSCDGRWIFREIKGGWAAVPIEGVAAEDKSTVTTTGVGFDPFVSPDNHWLLYTVRGAGSSAGIYVQPFPGPGPRREIAVTGFASSLARGWQGDSLLRRWGADVGWGDGRHESDLWIAA